MLWSRIIVESNTTYDQCSDSNNLKRQRSRSAASSLRRRFGKISLRQERYRADPELLQRFGRLFSPPDARSIISGCGSHAQQSLHQSQIIQSEIRGDMKEHDDKRPEWPTDDNASACPID